MERRSSRSHLLWAVLFWLLVWQGAGMAVGESLILASPMDVLKALWSLVFTAGFWQTVGASFLRIVSGFLLAVVAGTVLAVLAAWIAPLQTLLKPLMLVISSVPVASFIILALLWLNNAGNLAVLISFLMVLPILYANTLQGICGTDTSMLEMGRVYGLPPVKQARYLYAPQVWSYFQAGCKIGLGLCWKSGVAAEVIGITAHSIGGALHTAKLYYETAQVMAWTVVIVLVSLCFERAFLFLVGCGYRGLLKLPAPQKSTAPVIHPTELQFTDVDVEYGGEKVLSHLDMQFPAGSVVCLMGKSGLGKTTLLRLLLGLVEPTSGKVSGTAQRFGCVFQEDRLVPQLSALDNVRLVNPHIDAAQVQQAFAQVGLEPEVSAKPPSQLSGGQKRRVALVRALLSQSDVLLLDEPFSGLDTQARILSQQAVLSYSSGRTILCVTHSMEEAAGLGGEILQLADYQCGS